MRVREKKLKNNERWRSTRKMGEKLGQEHLSHCFYNIWWLLKEPLFVDGKPSEFTCCWCTWSQLWFLHWRRVSPVHRGEAAWWRFGSRGSWWLISCCSEPGAKLRQRCARKCRSRTSSWYPWLCWRYQCQGELASELCRCRSHNFPFSFLASSSCHRLRLLPFPLFSRLSFLQLWVPCL